MRRVQTQWPAVQTWLVWLAWLVGIAVAWRWAVDGGRWTPAGLVVVDGLTVVLWNVVTLFSGIVHSYSRRYTTGERHRERFFVRLGAFTLLVVGLVAADHVVVFWLAWLGMGLVMADLIGTNREWTQARAASRYAGRYFLASAGLLGVALAVVSWTTGSVRITAIVASDPTGGPAWLVVAAGLTLAAMIQSALVPFHGWLVASMTAPTPASALMHAGFVNAGGVLLVRFAPVVAADRRLLAVLVVVGAVTALAGTLMKTVRPAVKARLACSTTGQMGFMILQIGLGFFAAAITHLALHGCYKAYLFLSSGDAVRRTTPTDSKRSTTVGPAETVFLVVTALAGGGLFAVLTGKQAGSGVLLTGLVVVTTLHATRTVLRRPSLPAVVRYGVWPVVFLGSILVYAGVYQTIRSALGPAATTPGGVTPVDAVVVVAFATAYVAVEANWYERSDRLYVALVNATQPPSATVGGTDE